mgnify:CR=1 FL=1
MSSDLEHLVQLLQFSHISNVPKNPTLYNITYCHGKLMTRSYIPMNVFIGTIHGKLLNVYEIESMLPHYVIIDDETVLDTSINYNDSVLNYIKHSDESQDQGNCSIVKHINYMNGIATLEIYTTRNIQRGEELSLI